MSSTNNNPDPSSPEDQDLPSHMTIQIPMAQEYIYSNVSALATSLFDVRITFGEVFKPPSVTQKIGVVLPLEHAAILAINLLTQVNAYERSFGEIRTPEWQAFKKTTNTIIQNLVPEKTSTQPPKP